MRQYTYGHDLLSQRQQIGALWQTHYYGYDGHGSVRYLTDPSGAVTDAYAYDAFGSLVARTGSTPNDYLYAGERFDAEAGFYYLRARYMNPSTGRFLTKDTYEGVSHDPATLHKYLYANADPANRVDLSGHFFGMADIGAANSIRSTLANIQIDVGMAILDAVLYGGDRDLKDIVLTGAAIAGGVLIVRMVGRLMRRVPPRLALPPGRPSVLIANKLEPHEIAQAQEILAFRGGEFIGAAKRSFPGIDGTLDGIEVSLKRYTGSSPAGVLRHASHAEAQAGNAGYAGVEVFIDAKGVKAGTLLDFASKGPLHQIPNQGVVSAINVNTADGWVRIVGNGGT